MDALGQAMEASLRLLRHRGRSRHELEVALARRGFGGEVQAEVLRRLAELGYLDDVRFARHRAATLLREGRFGPEAILQKLLAHGLAESEARAALEEAQHEAGFEPLAAARALLERRGLWGRALTAAEKGRAARLLASRGFDGGVVERLLGEP